jgi:protein SCO1/2
MVGLTGSYEAVKAACKAYRVYFSTPPNTKPGTYTSYLLSLVLLLTRRSCPGDDYLVDHSIFFYLMDPAGNFIEAFGKSSAAHDVIRTFDEARKDWAERLQRGDV